MATRFEIVLHGDNPTALRAAGEEALDEIERLEAQLTLYRPGGEISRLNAEAHLRAVRVTPGLFRLLDRARALSLETEGVFDITIAPLVRCWGFMGGTGSMPNADAIVEARLNVGMNLVELDACQLTVHFSRPGVMLDLGAIGKGHAIDRAAELLREAGIRSALIHGGTSTTYAIGRPTPEARWKVAVTSPNADPEARPLSVVELEDESLSVSAVWGRSFCAGEKAYGHIIDPRTGVPAENALLSAVVLPNAAESDALSTALLTSPELMDGFIARRPDIRCLVARGSTTQPELKAHGMMTGERF